MERRSRRSLVAVIGTTVVLGLVLLLPFCGWLFQCGCTWAWAGGARHCNVNRSLGPHCPWCRYGDTAFYGVEGLIIGCQVGAAWLVWRRGAHAAWSASASMAGYLVGGLLVAGLWRLPSHYPYDPLHPPPSPPLTTADCPNCCCAEGR